MFDDRPSLGLLDRVRERDVMSQVVASVRAGQSQALVLRGEAGTGKTSLLRLVQDVAAGCTIIWTTGVESEMELAFAGLQVLCTPLLGRLGRLPEPQRKALSTAFGLDGGPPPDRFLVGLAVLSLLAESAEEQPIMCIVDDAQWLDSVSSETLAFVARRLLAERVGLLFALRDTGAAHVLDGLPDLVVEGLPSDDARLLLDAMVPGLIDDHVKSRILDEARGNPLALMELPRGVTPAELAGGFGLPDSRSLASRIEQRFVERIEALPRPTQVLLLLAAVEPLGDVGLLWRAAARIGIGDDAALPAEAAGLIDFGVRVRFSHPLVRSAAHRAFDPATRRSVRQALADATDPHLDPDRRAWHRAYATATPDEAVAEEMERSAGRAQSRGGLAAAAAFLQRAAELTPDRAQRVERSLAAAQAKLRVADARSATTLLDAAELGPLDDLQRARMERLRAQVTFLTRRGRDAPALLLEAASRLEPLDATLARDTYLEGISSAMFTGRFRRGPGERELAEAASNVVGESNDLNTAELLLGGLVARFTDGYAAGMAPLSRALRAFRHSDGREDDHQWLWLACRLAQDLWDDESWFELATLGVRVARDTGALALLPNALNHLAALNVHSGAFAAAAVLSDEVRVIARSIGLPPLDYSRYKLSANRGDRSAVQALVEGPLKGAAHRGEGAAIGMHWALAALMHNSYGEYNEAVAAAQAGCEFEEVMAYNGSLVELVEAGVRSGQRELADAAFDSLRERTQASGTAWALGVESRCRGLLTDDEDAYREAIEHLAQSRATVELARSRLVYGEWLRREGRRVNAREELRAAHESFSRMGADAFAERARRELLATGETARQVTADNWHALTPQELQVARLARDGYTNSEIGARLFVSPRTVEYHLSKVYRKLDVDSRRGLREVLNDPSHQLALGYV
ncbi:helix-turn-helix transcriptional regulator [Desertimonas flava]|uniref:helix-turn-helix transcriptional regulator n=1 Tax=Desertimonas flava TaxID=2064846 RepID=UPI000E348A74|nr:LuxR family transcriptional regulator [Desertimonas flava]